MLEKVRDYTCAVMSRATLESTRARIGPQTCWVNDRLAACQIPLPSKANALKQAGNPLHVFPIAFAVAGLFANCLPNNVDQYIPQSLLVQTSKPNALQS